MNYNKIKTMKKAYNAYKGSKSFFSTTSKKEVENFFATISEEKYQKNRENLDFSKENLVLSNESIKSMDDMEIESFVFDDKDFLFNCIKLSLSVEELEKAPKATKVENKRESIKTTKAITKVAEPTYKKIYVGKKKLKHYKPMGLIESEPNLVIYHVSNKEVVYTTSKFKDDIETITCHKNTLQKRGKFKYFNNHGIWLNIEMVKLL